MSGRAARFVPPFGAEDAGRADLQVMCLTTVAGWLERYRDFAPTASDLAFALLKCEDLILQVESDPAGGI